jgi:hypothetical protein
MAKSRDELLAEREQIKVANQKLDYIQKARQIFAKAVNFLAAVDQQIATGNVTHEDVRMAMAVSIMIGNGAVRLVGAMEVGTVQPASAADGKILLDS